MARKTRRRRHVSNFDYAFMFILFAPGEQPSGSSGVVDR